MEIAGMVRRRRFLHTVLARQVVGIELLMRNVVSVPTVL